jgi:hypothetical protein
MLLIDTWLRHCWARSLPKSLFESVNYRLRLCTHGLTKKLLSDRMLFMLNAHHLWYELAASFRAPILQSVRMSSILEQHLALAMVRSNLGISHVI